MDQDIVSINQGINPLYHIIVIQEVHFLWPATFTPNNPMQVVHHNTSQSTKICTTNNTE